MKKFALTALTVLSCGMLTALPVGNVNDASLYTQGVWWGRSCASVCDPCFSWCDAFSVRLGFYGDYVFNRHLETNTSYDSAIQVTELFTNAGYAALNICNWIDIFATFGSTNLYLDTTAQNQDNIFVDFSPEFSWSVGGRVSLWEYCNFGIGLEGQYFQFKPNLNFVRQLGVTAGSVYNYTDTSATYKEWQVGLGASYMFCSECPGTVFVPYVAVKWAGAKLNTGNVSYTPVDITYTIPNLENSKLWGYCVGLTLTQNETIGATVEGRWGDEKAVHTNLQIRF